GGVSIAGGFGHLLKNLIIDNAASDTTGGGGVHVAATGSALIGGNENDGNDLYGNQCPVSGASLASPARGTPIEARCNYFGAPPSAALVSFMNAFNTANARRKSIIIPATQTTLYISPTGNDETAIVIPPTPLRTVRQALRMFYTAPGEFMTLSLARGNYASVTNGEKLPIVLKSRTRLVGAHQDSVFLNGLNAARLLEIAEAESIEVRNVTLSNGKTADNGAGMRVRNAKSIALNGVHFNKNVTEGFGAGLAAEGVQNLQISRCRFSGNTGNGAGAFLRDGDGAIFGSTFESNKSPSRGSALYLENAAVQLSTNRIVQNIVEAGDTGGAIYCRGAIVPQIGGEVGKGNDIFNNTGGTAGKQISRTGAAPLINARYNYFGTPTPGEETASPLAGFDLSFARTQPLANNNAPVVQSVVPVTNQTIAISKADTVNFVASIVDPDNDPLTFVWYVDDFPRSFATNFDFFAVFYSEGLHTVRLTVNDGFNTLELLWSVQVGVTSVETEEAALPTSFKLEQAYPNPFHAGAGMSTITLQLPRTSEVHLQVYDLLGRQVRTLLAAKKSAGVHRLAWNGKDDAGRLLPNGVYVVKLIAGAFHATQKIMLMR
ncbi:right-handed parallel beta-helix repeat-containing protein, partial [candidate division KSB1 bacterium]|nr:right-handed parallel beta-helix repeat-containing protein [candidate division KSB1 bacterium]